MPHKIDPVNVFVGALLVV